MSEERRETFEVGGKPKVELKSLPAGHASFLPGENGSVEVAVEGYHADEFVIEQFGDRVSIQAPERLDTRWDSFEVTVRMPAGTELGANVASADVDIEVDLARLGFNSASGDLRAKSIEGNARINTASGDVSCEKVGGNVGLNTASGDVRVREVKGNLGANTASGDLRVESAFSDLGFRSASGDLEVGSYGGESLECNTQTGNVKIALPPGRTLEVDMNTLTGDIRNELGEAEGESEKGDSATARLRVKTLSGDITLGRVASLPEE
ncbi:MAG: DUF4097 family beta strand repeat-containing protein [Rubrobacteraceae bacterium]